MSFKGIFKGIGKVGKTVGEIVVAGIPAVQQFETIAAIINSSQAQAHEKNAATVLLNNLKETPVITPDNSSIGGLESKRFKMILIGMGTLILVHLGWLPKEIVDELTPYLITLILGYVGVETFRPSEKKGE